MKFLSAFLIFLIFSTINVSVADEVGNNIFVAQPKAKPAYVNFNGNVRYYPCSGFINKDLIPIVFNELKFISNTHNVSPPSREYCFYEIAEYEINSITLTYYMVNMYINKKSMKSCILANKCEDRRTMVFTEKNEKFYRQYMITNKNRELTKFMWVSHEGKIVNAAGRC
jgi:hypothetical protein